MAFKSKGPTDKLFRSKLKVRLFKGSARRRLVGKLGTKNRNLKMNY